MVFSASIGTKPGQGKRHSYERGDMALDLEEMARKEELVLAALNDDLHSLWEHALCELNVALLRDGGNGRLASATKTHVLETHEQYFFCSIYRCWKWRHECQHGDIRDFLNQLPTLTISLRGGARRREALIAAVFTEASLYEDLREQLPQDAEKWRTLKRISTKYKGEDKIRFSGRFVPYKEKRKQAIRLAIMKNAHVPNADEIPSYLLGISFASLRR